MLKLDLIKYKSGHLLWGTGKGTYVLLLLLDRENKIMVGRGRGSFSILFRSGYYAYVGSAHGPGGLRSRIKRHLIKEKMILNFRVDIISNNDLSPSQTIADKGFLYG